MSRNISTERHARNKEGAKVRSSFDGTHKFKVVKYCGRFVGLEGYENGRCNSNSCQGYCGPTNGCQCSACYDLNEEMKRRKRIFRNGSDSERILANSEDVVCQVSYCVSAIHTAGYKFYCGRHVGRHNYFPFLNGCDCNGYCGPDNGCQCRSCFELDRRLSELEYPQHNNSLSSAVPQPIIREAMGNSSTSIYASTTSITYTASFSTTAVEPIDTAVDTLMASYIDQISSVDECEFALAKVKQWKASIVSKKVRVLGFILKLLCGSLLFLSFRKRCFWRPTHQLICHA